MISDVSDAESGVRLELAGSVRGWVGGRQLQLGPPQRCAVLAILVLRAGRVVTVDEIIDGIWGNSPPARPLSAVQAHISSLRRVLEPARAPWSSGNVLKSGRGGYALDVIGIEVDLFRFRHHVNTARMARESGDTERYLAILHGALRQWSGVGLVGLPGPAAELASRALFAERLDVFEEYWTAQLAHDPALLSDVELQGLIVDNPHRERLYGLRMDLLRQKGLRKEALEVYTELRARLVEDLGIEPCADLKQLHRLVLSDERSGARPARRRTPVLPVRIEDDFVFRTRPDISVALPPDCLVARREQLDHLDKVLHPGTDRVVVIRGMPGVGTTAVAMTAAAQAQHRFTGGVRVVSATGGSAADVAPGTLLVLDGIHRESDIATRLGTAVGTAATVVQHLIERGVVVMLAGTYWFRGLRGAHDIEVLPLGHDDALELYRRKLGPELVESEPEATERLLSRNAGLTVTIVALSEMLLRHPTWKMSVMVEAIKEHEEDPTWVLAEAVGPFIGHAFAALDQDSLEMLLDIAQLGETFTRKQINQIRPHDRHRTTMLLQRLMDHSLLAEPQPMQYVLHRSVHWLASVMGRLARADTGPGTVVLDLNNLLNPPAPAEPSGATDPRPRSA